MHKIQKKFLLENTDFQTLSIPSSFKTLLVQNQCGDLCLWVVCDIDCPKIDVVIHITGTENSKTENNMEFIDSVELDGFTRNVFQVV
jgi:hypothetical protein